MKRRIFTNCFLVRGVADGRVKEVCLAMKKRGFGAGMWNGSGGKLNDGESVDEAAIREVNEELGTRLTKMSKRAEISWYIREEDKLVECFVYFGEEWDGEPKETEEMAPKWFGVEEIPYDQMWKSDREWLAEVLRGRKIRAKYTYAREGGEVEERSLENLNCSEIK
ncbi:MAG: 8-oxo-dGTP diphosphatase [Candidatus Shapirobacteria bacterium]